MVHEIDNRTGRVKALPRIRRTDMKLIKSNILEVKRLECDGVTYEYFVVMKGRYVSDARQFINYNEQGRTTVEEYAFERLPKAVQNFINDHEEKLLRDWEATKDGKNFKEYIIK